MTPANTPSSNAKTPEPRATANGGAGAAWEDDPIEASVTPLNHDQALALFGERALRPSRVTPAKVVLMQVAITLLSALAWYIGRDRANASSAAISALLGGAAYFLPGALFALRLALAGPRPSISGLVVGEAIKVFGTVALLALAVVLYKPMDWAALLITLLLALKMYWVALAFR